MAKKSRPQLPYSDIEQSFLKVLDLNPDVPFSGLTCWQFFTTNSHEDREKVIKEFFSQNRNLVDKLPMLLKNFVIAHLI